MDVKLPDGTIIRGVPEGTTKAELSRRLGLTQASAAPTPPLGQRALQTLDDVARSIAQGVTFGFADEIAARVNPAINRALGLDAPETTEEALAEERARDEAIPAAIAIPGQMAGAIGSTLLAAPAVGAAAARAGVTALPKAVQFGALGAAEGAVTGAGTATEGERLQGAALGAPVGAAVGAAAPTVITGVMGLANRLRRAGSSQVAAAQDLARAMRRDETSQAVMEARAQGMQADRPGTVALADVGGENVRGLVERAAQTPGGARARIVPRLEGRQRQQAFRLMQDLRGLTGTNRTAREAISATIANRRQSASPIYRAVFRQFDEAIRSPEIDRLMGSPTFVEAMRGAVKSGKDRAVSEGFGAFNPGVRVSDDGRIVFQRSRDGGLQYPNLQYWDAVKRELDDMGRSVTGPVGRQQPTNKAQDARNMARLLRTELDNLTGGEQSAYRQARNLWSGDAAYLDAIEEGRRIANRNVSAEELTARVAAMSEAERSAFREGAISSLVGRVGNDASKLGDMTKFFRSPEMRAKIAAIMPNQELADAWARRLDFEVQASELTGQALGNSATSRRLAQREDQEDLAADLVLDALSGAGSATLLSRILTAGPRWMRDNLRKRTDAELGDLLTNPARLDDLQQVLERTVMPGADRQAGLNEALVTAAGVPALFDL